MKTYIFLLLAFAITMTSCSTTDVAQEEELFESAKLVSMTTPEEELFEMVNHYRIENGYNPLIFSEEAYQAAQEHNAYMITENKISHDNFNKRASKLAQQTNAVVVAENVAKDFGTNEGALNGWLNSESHKKTIEGDFTHTAVSISISGNGKPFFTQIFYRK